MRSLRLEVGVVNRRQGEGAGGLVAALGDRDVEVVDSLVVGALDGEVRGGTHLDVDLACLAELRAVARRRGHGDGLRAAALCYGVR